MINYFLLCEEDFNYSNLLEVSDDADMSRFDRMKHALQFVLLYRLLLNFFLFVGKDPHYGGLF